MKKLILIFVAFLLLFPLQGCNSQIKGKVNNLLLKWYQARNFFQRIIIIKQII